MKKKILVSVFIVMFLLGTILIMNVFGVDPSQFTGTDSDVSSKSYYSDEFGVIFRLLQILINLIWVNMVIGGIIKRKEYLKTEKDNVEKRKELHKEYAGKIKRGVFIGIFNIIPMTIFLEMRFYIWV